MLQAWLDGRRPAPRMSTEPRDRSRHRPTTAEPGWPPPIRPTPPPGQATSAQATASPSPTGGPTRRLPAARAQRCCAGPLLPACAGGAGRPGCSLAGGLGGWWVLRQVNPPDAPGKRRDRRRSPTGSSDRQIASVLENQGVVTNASGFRYYVKLTSAGPFRAGLYDGLHAPETMSEVVKRLNQARCRRRPAPSSSPEGLWLSEIRAKILATFPADEARPSWTPRWPPCAPSTSRPGSTNLEGFLFPATYQVLLTDEADEQKLVQQMVHQVRPDRRQHRPRPPRQQAVGLTPYQVLTVASMVEEEAKVPTDAPKIARVIYNRLAKNLSLGLDTTVEYALQQRVRQPDQVAAQPPTRPTTPGSTPGCPPRPSARPGGPRCRPP